MGEQRRNVMPRRGFGWVPDLPDHRDLAYAAPPAVTSALPDRVDLRGQCPAVYDQGRLGSCTANAIAAAHQFDQAKPGLEVTFRPSRLFIYYNERDVEGTVDSDAGAMLRDGIKGVSKLGACRERQWPYHVGRFRRRPTDACYQAAARHKAVSYRRISRTLAQMKGCLAEGYPWVFGFTVYESFEGDDVTNTGVVPMPRPSEAVLGGHAVLAVGYDDPQKMFIARNSWGGEWGLAGYFMMPYAYLLDENLSDDFWTIRSVQ